MKDSPLVVAFDVDDTLIIPPEATGNKYDVPNHKTIAIYRWFKNQGAYMIVWSGGGVPYARRWVEKLNLNPDEIRMKQKSADVDIAFDDCDVDLARVNVKVKRLNNQVKRKNLHNDSE